MSTRIIRVVLCKVDEHLVVIVLRSSKTNRVDILEPHRDADVRTRREHNAERLLPRYVGEL